MLRLTPKQRLSEPVLQTSHQQWAESQLLGLHQSSVCGLLNFEYKFVLFLFSCWFVLLGHLIRLVAHFFYSVII